MKKIVSGDSLVAPVVLLLSLLNVRVFFPACLYACQGSDSELKVEKDGVLDGESKVDSGVPEVPVPPDDTPEVLNKALSGLSSRYAYC